MRGPSGALHLGMPWSCVRCAAWLITSTLPGSSRTRLRAAALLGLDQHVARRAQRQDGDGLAWRQVVDAVVVHGHAVAPVAVQVEPGAGAGATACTAASAASMQARSGSFRATLAIRRGTSTMRSYIGRRSLRQGTSGSNAANCAGHHLFGHGRPGGSGCRPGVVHQLPASSANREYCDCIQ